MIPLLQRRLDARVLGRVQGVGFRFTTQVEARRQGIGGWVCNCPDGAVQVQAEGDEAALQSFLEFLRRGPLGAHVVAVQVQWSSPQGASVPFQIRSH